MRRRRSGWAPALLAATLVVGACSEPPVEQTLTESDVVAALAADGTSDELARCVVGLAERRLDMDQLLPDAELAPEEAAAMEEIRASCISAAQALEPDAPPPRLALDSSAFNIGDDAELDRLWVACERGDGAACDELWQEAPVGSVYESFGITCGNRPEILDCTAELVLDNVDATGEGESAEESPDS